MSDPYFNDVSLLLHMDGSDGSTTFTDSSSNGLTITANGNAQIDTAESKFGGAAGLFDSVGSYLAAPTGGVLDLGFGDFTIEAWVRIASFSGNNTLYSTGNTAGVNGCLFTINTSGKVQVFGGNASRLNAGSVSLNTWTHVAFVRSGTTIEAFIDGSSVGTGSLSNNLNGATSNWIGYRNYGGSPGDYFNGWIDDLRITKGVARYTSNFTPPTAAFPDSAGGGSSSVEIGQTVETDSALPIEPKFALGIPAETDEALSVTPNIIIGVLTGQASESDAALPMTRKDPVRTAVETDAALGITPLYPPKFTDPVSVTDDAGTVVTFSITDIDDPVGDVTYQWYDQNGAIDSATDTTYQRELAPEDDGEAVYVIATNGVGARQSSDATMTVNTTDSGVGDVAPITYRLRFGTYREPFYKNGTVILSRPLAEGESLSIERKTPITKDISFTFLEEPDWNAFEYQIDKYTMICQEIEGHLCECLECIVPQATLSATIITEDDYPECVEYACDALTAVIPTIDARLWYPNGADGEPLSNDGQTLGDAGVSGLPEASGLPYRTLEGGSTIRTGEGSFGDECVNHRYIEVGSIITELDRAVFEKTSAGSGGINRPYANIVAGSLLSNAPVYNTFYLYPRGGFAKGPTGQILRDRTTFYEDGPNAIANINVAGIPEDEGGNYAIDTFWEFSFTANGDTSDFRVFSTLMKWDSTGSGGDFSTWVIPDALDFSDGAPHIFTIKRQLNGYVDAGEDGYYGEWQVAVYVDGLEVASRTLYTRYFDHVSFRDEYGEPDRVYVYGDTNPEESLGAGSRLSNIFSNNFRGRVGHILVHTQGLDELRTGYLRNFASYTPPTYCENLPAGDRLTVSPALPGQSISILPGAEIELKATVTAGTPPFSYQWYKDDVAIDGATDATYEFTYNEPADGGEFKVIVSNACGETSGLSETTYENFVVIEE